MNLTKEQYEKFDEALKIAIYTLNTYKAHREECVEASQNLMQLQALLKNDQS